MEGLDNGLKLEIDEEEELKISEERNQILEEVRKKRETEYVSAKLFVEIYESCCKEFEEKTE